MQDHEGNARQYYLRSESWYAEVNKEEGVIDQVQFGLYAPTGGCSGEMSVKWRLLGGRITPRLECYDDAWGILAQFKDVIDAMAEVNDKAITPKQFCELLDKCGFEDATQREWR